MTEPVHHMLAGRGLLPAEHFLDSGYASAELIVGMKKNFGVTLVTPVLLNSSPQARAGAGFDRTAFTIDWEKRQATCPRGDTSTWWRPAALRGTKAIVIKFDKETCRPCPVRDQCTRSKTGGRTLSLISIPEHGSRELAAGPERRPRRPPEAGLDTIVTCRPPAPAATSSR
ncbi:transposase [Streptomyces sp. NPDC005969]|uniref:transposase n=1 Tax=Streptomyces sp. NPDC005969 TaxID=3156722 RepID=UPI0033CD39DF